VGFVGGTGCGKSTSLYLLERWYNPQRGSILLDGRNIADYDVYHLRRHMSVVAQVTCLFSTTIRENIVYGLPPDVKERISDADIEQALRQANAWKFVNDFPRKLETYAGERGVKLSGGQKQRLAIARAIIRKPTLIFLDEATSALDSKAEQVVQEALDKMIDEHANGSTIIIAHRLSTLRTCNRSIVMDEGSIKESGSHDELMHIEIEKDASGNMVTGWYRDLYETQHGKSKDKEGPSNTEVLKAELDSTKQMLKVLKEENTRLRTEQVESRKLELGKRIDRILDEVPLRLNLTRHISETSPYCSHDKNVPPMRLTLDRARTS
jgi:ABC-type multidrug transport system fused ATPase/permease subunit